LINQIRIISGIPGLSLGVLHDGEVVHHANFGYRDVSAQIPPDEDTIYVVASLSKAFTSAMTGILVERGDLQWDTQVRHILPGYQRDERDSACNATVSDILSHRTGVLGPDGYWMLSEGKVAFPRDQFVPIFNSLPTVQPTRTAFIYNNYAYELMGQVIEKVSGTTVGNFLKESIMKPLGMTRTFDTRIPPSTKNVAKPYASLLNRTVYELGMPLVRQDGLFSAAGGLRTSVSDLLRFYNALMDAEMSQLGEGDQRISGNPLKQLRAIWTGMVSLPFSALREHSYAFGWARAQLPSTFGLDGPKPWKAIVGKRSPCRLVLYHQGIIQGFTSFSALIPETRSAVAVLTNSGGLNEAGILVASAVLDTLFGGEIDDQAYKDLAKIGYEEAASRLSDIMKELKDGQQVDVPTRPLADYTGRYYNSLDNYFIDIQKSSHGGLFVSFMDKPTDTFKLVPYESDKFFWYLTHDECVSRGRLTEFPIDYYLIKFAFDENDTTLRDPVLYWKYDSDYPGDGEPFRRVGSYSTFGLKHNVWERLYL
jgi:CubicO group peptidase (beta-lactamase class C family)